MSHFVTGHIAHLKGIHLDVFECSGRANCTHFGGVAVAPEDMLRKIMALKCLNKMCVIVVCLATNAVLRTRKGRWCGA